jgi:hypothetical protein
MPFSKIYDYNIPPAGWDTMQAAHNKASDMLGRCPKTHEHSERLAREIIRIYEAGERDPIMIALMATEIEIDAVHRSRGVSDALSTLVH